jgi:hypothetical protein
MPSVSPRLTAKLTPSTAFTDAVFGAKVDAKIFYLEQIVARRHHHLSRSLVFGLWSLGRSLMLTFETERRYALRVGESSLTTCRNSFRLLCCYQIAHVSASKPMKRFVQ